MTKTEVRLLHRQLGYGIEPALSRAHPFFKRLDVAIERIKSDYVTYTPTRLQADQDFGPRCERLIDRYGPRIWVRGYGGPLKYDKDYPRALRYAGDREKLVALFYRFVSEKCRVNRQTELDKASRARRDNAAAATSEPTHQHHARSGIRQSVEVSDHDADAARHSALGIDGVADHEAEEAATPLQSGHRSPTFSEIDLTGIIDAAQADPDDGEYFPPESSTSQTVDWNYQDGREPASHGGRRPTRRGTGGAFLAVNALKDAVDLESVDSAPVEASNEAAVRGQAGAILGRSPSPPHAGNTLKRRASRMQDHSTRKRSRVARFEAPVAQMTAASPNPDVDGDMFNVHDTGSKEADDGSPAIFRYPSTVPSGLGDRGEGRRTARLSSAEGRRAMQDSIEDGDDNLPASGNGDCSSGSPSTEGDELMGRMNVVERQDERFHRGADSAGGTEKRPIASGSLSGRAIRWRSSSYEEEGRNRSDEPRMDSPQQDSGTSSRKHQGSAAKVSIHSRVAPSDEDIPEKSATAKGKEPIRPARSRYSQEPPAASSSRRSIPAPTSPVSSTTSSLMLVAWSPENNRRSDPIWHLTQRKKGSIWNTVKAAKPAALVNQEPLGLDLYTVQMSARELLKRFGKCIVPDAVDHCCQFLMEEVYGDEANAEKVWDTVEVFV